MGSAFCFALLAGLWAGTGFCQVSHLFKFKHTSSISISLEYSCHPFPQPFLLGWMLIQQQQVQQLQAPPRQRGRSSCSTSGEGSSCSACCQRCCCTNCVYLVLVHCSRVLLVFKLVLDDLGLGATAGALNPLDVLVIGCQDCLHLLLEGVRFHFVIS